MKFSEYKRLAKLSLKTHKKSSNATIRGLAVGFIILLPILIVLFGINVSISKQLNNAPYLLYMETTMSDYRVKTNNVQGKSSYLLSGSENIDYLINSPDIKDVIVYEPQSFSNTSEYCIGNNDYKTIKQAQFKNYFSIIDLDKSSTYFPENLIKYYPEGIFIKGYDQGFINDGKKQVVLSEKMLIRNSLEASDVYLKNITIKCNSNFEFEKNIQTELTGYLCKDYTVVGIIKNEVSALYEITTSFTPFMYSEMFFTSVNVYKDGQGVLKPTLKADDTGEYKYIHYDNLNEKDILNEEYMMLGWGQGYKKSYDAQNAIFKTDIYYESNSYKNLNNDVIRIQKHINNIFGTDIGMLSISNTFTNFNRLFKIANILSYLFGIVALIIVLCSFINLYTTIKHSVEQNRYYLTMLRAIGAHDETVPKLYLTQSIILISRANIFIASIGSALCIALKLLIDNILKSKNIPYNLSVPWSIIILCVIAVILIMYTISILFAYLCTYKLSKKPIISILNNL